MALTSDQLKNYWNDFSSFYGDNLEEGNMLLGISLSKMLKLDSAKNILEVGCATGSLSLHWLRLLPSDVKYTAIDFSEEMIKIADKRKEQLKAELGDNIRAQHTFLTADAQDLSNIPDESIDVYISPLCIHTVLDAGKALKEAMRVVKKGGRIGFSVLGPAEKSSFFALCYNQTEQLKIENTTGKGRSPHYLGTPEKLIGLAKEAGIEVDYCWDQELVVDVFNHEDLMKLFMIPRFSKFLKELEEDKRTKLLDGIRKDFEEKKKNYTPLKTHNLLLVGRKPE